MHMQCRGDRHNSDLLTAVSIVCQAIAHDAVCWVQHMQLDHRTGLDPDNIRLRASACAAHPYL